MLVLPGLATTASRMLENTTRNSLQIVMVLNVYLLKVDFLRKM